MPIAAVPKYMQAEDPEFYLSAPPGHRFLLYLPVWGENGESGEFDWRQKDRVRRYKPRKGRLVEDGWTDLENGQFACTIAACKMPPYFEEMPRKRKPKPDPGPKKWEQMMRAVQKRQTLLAEQLPNLLRFDAVSTAPFTTGLGNEHPLENGFAFLNPYGLPYLSGSSIKGVLRQAAAELASGKWDDSYGWVSDPFYPLIVDGEPLLDSKRQPVVLSMIDVLFGRETSTGESYHVRGALSFWDAIPELEGDGLDVEIMTPHYSDYYQQKAGGRNGDSVAPHDSGQPTPITFLTVPPHSIFRFHVACDLEHLKRLTGGFLQGAPDLLADGRTNWKSLLEAAFIHAFEWLGFGAKTAVGYGAMRRMNEEEQELFQEREQVRRIHCDWVDRTLAEIESDFRSDAEEALRGKVLAERWQNLDDPELKRRALEDIRLRWEKRGWWEEPPGRAARRAKQIYEAGC